VDAQAFVSGHWPFIVSVVNWYRTLETIELDKLTGDPNKVAVIGVDLLDGFCYKGALASPRVEAIITPIVNLLGAAWARQVRSMALVQDAHNPDAIEFAQWGPHCIRGTEEAEVVAAVQGLPFFDSLEVFEKNSTSASIDTGLDEWLDRHPQIATFIVLGSGTDLSVFQLAMHLRLRANARQLGGVRVIVPANCVDTFDLQPQKARKRGMPLHPAEFMHVIFLYNMMQNGITVVERIAF
jgi:nicotinamidase-related amidase